MKQHIPPTIILVIIFPALISSCLSNSGPAGSPRILPQGLSDKEPGSKQYDQEAFLGRDKAKDFESFSTEESKRKLALMVRKIDTNGDSLVSKSELVVWINKTHTKYITSSSDVHFAEIDNDDDGLISWNQYDIQTYSFVDSQMYEIGDEEHVELGYLRTRDERRWMEADTDDDGSLTKTEFRAFLYPEEFTHTRPNYVRETMDQIDTDHDNFVDFQEYMNDLLSPEDQKAQPGWVDAERIRFRQARDTDGNGKLDLEEVTAWLFPVFTEVESEAKHLIEVSDHDKDGELNLKEILDNHDTFAGSKVTEWGEALKTEL